jgi:hypothetical protein
LSPFRHGTACTWSRFSEKLQQSLLQRLDRRIEESRSCHMAAPAQCIRHVYQKEVHDAEGTAQVARRLFIHRQGIEITVTTY